MPSYGGPEEAERLRRIHESVRFPQPSPLPLFCGHPRKALTCLDCGKIIELDPEQPEDGMEIEVWEGEGGSTHS